MAEIICVIAIAHNRATYLDKIQNEVSSLRILVVLNRFSVTKS